MRPLKNNFTSDYDKSLLRVINEIQWKNIFCFGYFCCDYHCNVAVSSGIDGLKTIEASKLSKPVVR